MPKTSKKAPKIVSRNLEAKGFYTDFEKEGMLYAALIRSPATTGIVKDIKIQDLPEDYSLFTAKDIPGKKTIDFNNSLLKILGYGNVNYTGEPLAIVTGPDETKVHELADRASVFFDIQNLESALTKVMKARQESDGDFDTLASDLSNLPSLDSVVTSKREEGKDSSSESIAAERIIKYGFYENLSLEEAHQKLFTENTIEETWQQDISNPKWHEPNGCFCYTEDAKLHVYVPTKWTYFLQNALSQTLSIDPELIFIHKTKTSGVYYDGLWKTSQIALQTAVASYLLKKPVKLIFTQSEQEKYMSPGVTTKSNYKCAVSEKGIINAMEIDIDIDVGSSNPFAQEITDRIAIASTNFYRPQNLYIHAVAKKSKNPPTTINIKGVDSQSFFAIENQLQKISNVTGIFPDDLRIINLKNTKTSVFPFDIEIENIEEVIQNTVKMSDFNRKYASFHMDSIDRVEQNEVPFFALPLRGIGLSCAYNTSGYNGSSSFSYYPKIEVTLYPDEKLVIHTIQPSEVNQDIWKTSAAKILDIPKGNIHIDSNFTVKEIPKSPEDTFSTIGIINQLIKKCCLDIQKKRFHQPLPITSKKGGSVPSKQKWNKESFSGNPFMATSRIACAVEVELDTYTYREKIRGIWLTIDCGEILDLNAAKRTVNLEIQKELSMLVKGTTVSADNIFIQFIPSKDSSAQVGELVHNSLPAAFTSALSSALATQVTKLPCTEQQLFSLIKKRGENQK